MSPENTVKQIQTIVAEFFEGRPVCYATPGTENHQSNFYGDTHVCEFTPDDLAGVIAAAHENWTNEDGDRYPVDEAAEIVLSDMQFDLPEDAN